VARRANSDEHYIIGLCDQVLGERALRGHRFDFLRGDPGKHGSARLPVDAFYEHRNLVVEYYERQHCEAVPHFDKPDRITVSGVSRGEQRRVYDERRRTVLPQHGVDLIVLKYNQFSVNSNGKLRRLTSGDLIVIKSALSGWVSSQPLPGSSVL
jgi:hypothetical protein